MTDPRSWTGRALRMAVEGTEPDLDRLRAALPEILARARRERASGRQETVLEALLPVGRRMLPPLAAAAASLVLAALLLDPGAEAIPAEAWEVSLLAQAADEAQTAEAVTEAMAGGFSP